MFRVSTLCCLFVFCFSPASAQIANDVMYAHFIDVGQGDATLLEFSCGAILIDAGGQNGETTDKLCIVGSLALRQILVRKDTHLGAISCTFLNHSEIWR